MTIPPTCPRPHRGLELTEPSELTRLISAASTVLAERDTATTCP
jgi:hypothetical protein